MDPLWIVFAFVLGLAASRLGLPPLVGFLAAGFALHAAGIKGGEVLDQVADLGVQLLLFGIGLKLDLRSLARLEIWGTASLHGLLTIGFFSALLYALGLTGIAVFAELEPANAVLIAFALSFSSTVFAVKVLEDRGEMVARHGVVAIGILIVQDVFAVLFLTASKGELPSLWALALLALPAARPLLFAITRRCGHGELLLMWGLLLTAGGGALFDLVGLKEDLGALCFGLLLAASARASELSKTLLGLKDLLLVGFFLQVGLEAPPTLQAVAVALGLTLLVVVKVGLFFALMTRLRLRARTATFASLSLANYSEFGLIVGAVGAKAGWIHPEWLVILALSLAFTFVGAAPVNAAAHSLYGRHAAWLRRFEGSKRVPGDEAVEPGNAEIAVLGMGRVGTQAYDALCEHGVGAVVGLDADAAVAAAQREAGRAVLHGDATDEDFWERGPSTGPVKLVLLTLPSQSQNVVSIQLLRGRGYAGRIAAIAKFDDEVAELKTQGADVAYNLYAEAGVGFAESVRHALLEPDAANTGGD